jgi:hypothetical protein
MKPSKRKLKDPHKRAAHYRELQRRTDRKVRCDRAAYDWDMAMHQTGHALPLASQPVQPRAGR